MSLQEEIRALPAYREDPEGAMEWAHEELDVIVEEILHNDTMLARVMRRAYQGPNVLVAKAINDAARETLRRRLERDRLRREEFAADRRLDEIRWRESA